MRLPEARGPLGAEVHRLLRETPDGQPGPDVAAYGAEAGEEDRTLTLWVLQELGYRGFDDVDEAWEHHPALAAVRHPLERELEQRLRERYDASGPPETPSAEAVAETLLTLADTHDGPSVARHVEKRATREQVEDLLRQRSVYHLKEADPTAWVVPRLDAAPKAALVQVQYDEYGTGRPEQLHHALFERGLADSGLDAKYGAYVDAAGLETLEQNVTNSMFGQHRRLRGAAVGHFAAFEATSSLPSRRMAAGLRRLGFAESMAAYYDEHVEADAVHEQLAARDVCGALVAAEPHLAADVVFGAWTCLDLESRSAAALLDEWGVTS